MDPTSYDGLVLGLAWYFVFVMSTSCHEAAHAWAALRLGDPTAYLGGQVSLNPLPHIVREPIGMLAIPIISFLLKGWIWGWASAPYNPLWAARWPKRAAWMALAGPAANLAIALLAGTALWIGLHNGFFVPPDGRLESFDKIAVGHEEGISTALGTMLSITFALNSMLCVFNLLPFPPLDGSGVLPLLIGTQPAHRYHDFMAQPGFMIMGMIVAWNIFPRIFFPYVFEPVLRLLYGGL